MEFIEQWGQNILTLFTEKPRLKYLTLAFIGLVLLCETANLLITSWKIKK